MEKRGTIRTVTNINGSTNGKDWVRYEFEMTDGNKYSTFDKDLFDKFGAGMSVVMFGEMNGKYWSMNGMELEVEKVKESPITTSNEYSPKDRSIIAQCLTKCYCNTAVVDMDKEGVLSTYRWYLANL